MIKATGHPEFKDVSIVSDSFLVAEIELKSIGSKEAQEAFSALKGLILGESLAQCSL